MSSDKENRRDPGQQTQHHSVTHLAFPFCHISIYHVNILLSFPDKHTAICLSCVRGLKKALPFPEESDGVFLFCQLEWSLNFSMQWEVNPWAD